jgi:hypothetical protein
VFRQRSLLQWRRSRSFFALRVGTFRTSRMILVTKPPSKSGAIQCKIICTTTVPGRCHCRRYWVCSLKLAIDAFVGQ